MVFINYANSAVRLTGRWGRLSDNVIAATATGSYIEFAFVGKTATVFFETEKNAHPFPHLWVSVDGGALIECPLDRFLRINAQTDGNHVVKIIFKGAVEMQHRWYMPLVGHIGFCGFYAEAAGVLGEDNRKTIEFIGDSITEGVLIDVCTETSYYNVEQHNRVYQDDVCATYAWLTAEALNLRPFFMGYGAVGATQVGQGSVPRACEAYPYNFCGSPVTYPQADYILINHGANDGCTTADNYVAAYGELIDAVRKRNPNSKIFSLSAFYGTHASELKAFIDEYNERNNDNIIFIDSTGWVPREPFHPLRDGHRQIADKLIEIMKKLV